MGLNDAREGVAFGMSWDHPKKGRAARATVALMVALSFLPWVRAASPSAARLISVIVREAPRAGSAPEELVRTLGGQIGRHIGIIEGFVAQIPAGGLGVLTAAPAIHSVTPDSRIQLLHAVDGFDGETDPGSMFNVAQRVARAGEYWNSGYSGKGIDVALIDSGVVPVKGLTAPGKVVNGPDLSFESQAPDLRYLDTYGHGTHMAGIIAGRDDEVPVPVKRGNHDLFMGMAPEARVVSLKVADVNGATDVSQVIAAIDWVVQHRNDKGLNIRVLNLSFGTDGVQDYRLDPLTYAAEVAWRKGIVVVVSAGNRGFGSAKLNNPAYDPYVIAVGADDPKGTYGTQDDTVPSFSSCGNDGRFVDLVAPGKSVVSLRDPGSSLDTAHPEGQVNPRFFRGSGTSQAAAVVSGAVGPLLPPRPAPTPDQVKALLTSTATPLVGASAACQGAGLLDLKAARDAPTPPLAVQAWPPATGVGSLEQARGSAHLAQGGVELSGEKDIFGARWDGAVWAPQSLAGTSWVGGRWNGNAWTGDAWSPLGWTGMSWSSVEWTGMSWSGMSWSGMSWGGMSWGGMSWGGMSWRGMSWSGASWGGMG